MSQNLLAPGTYPAKTNAQMVVYEADSGSLCVSVPIIALDAEGNQLWSGKTTICLGKSDGTLMTKSIENLKRCFGWDGKDPFALEEIEAGANDLEIVGEHEEYTPKATNENPDPQPVSVFKIKWLNPPGGGGAAMKEPLSADERKKVLTKWGSKFKATAGATTASKPATTKPSAAPVKPAAKAPPTPPSRGKAPPKAAARTSTQEEVWTLLKQANADESDEALAEKYYAAQDEVAPGANGELTAEQWGEVATKLEV